MLSTVVAWATLIGAVAVQAGVLNNIVDEQWNWESPSITPMTEENPWPTPATEEWSESEQGRQQNTPLPPADWKTDVEQHASEWPRDHWESSQPSLDKCDWWKDNWTEMPCSATRFGQSRDCPALSCHHILEVNPWAKDGIYYVHVMKYSERDVVFPVFCHMSQRAFTLVAKLPTGAKVDTASSWWAHKHERNEGNRDHLQLGAPEWGAQEPYKNRLLKHWKNNINWTEIRVALVKDGEIVQFVDFSLQNSWRHDDERWFKTRNILRSSWLNLNKTTQARRTRITGQEGRSFILSLDHISGCSGNPGVEVGWMMATSNKGWCEWETSLQQNGLVWLYSKKRVDAPYNDIGQTVGIADAALFFLR